MVCIIIFITLIIALGASKHQSQDKNICGDTFHDEDPFKIILKRCGEETSEYSFLIVILLLSQFFQCMKIDIRMYDGSELFLSEMAQIFTIDSFA